MPISCVAEAGAGDEKAWPTQRALKEPVPGSASCGHRWEDGTPQQEEAAGRTVIPRESSARRLDVPWSA